MSALDTLATAVLSTQRATRAAAAARRTAAPSSRERDVIAAREDDAFERHYVALYRYFVAFEAARASARVLEGEDIGQLVVRCLRAECAYVTSHHAVERVPWWRWIRRLRAHGAVKAARVELLGALMLYFTSTYGAVFARRALGAA